MKIGLYSSSNYSGGAARAADRLHRALLDAGAAAVMNTGHKWREGRSVRGPVSRWEQKLAGGKARVDQLLPRLQRTDNTEKHSAGRLSYMKAKEINRSSYDVINLHWICNGFLSVEEIGKIGKPLVWTLHDMWPFCGAEHYASLADEVRWKEGYFKTNRYPEHGGWDIDRWAWNRKKKCWKRPFQIVTPSRWLAGCVRESALMRDWPVAVIPNPLDTELFRPHDKAAARESLGLPPDAQLILFSSPFGISVRHKGWDLLEQALRRIGRRSDVHGVVIGQDEPESFPGIGLPLHWMGYIDDEAALAQLYSAADVTVVPSRVENLPQAGTEAQACGCPVVAFDIAGLTDVVEHRRSGYLAEALSTESLAGGIEWVLEDSERRAALSKCARERAVALWAEEVVAEQYLDLFHKVIEGSKS